MPQAPWPSKRYPHKNPPALAHQPNSTSYVAPAPEPGTILQPAQVEDWTPDQVRGDSGGWGYDVPSPPPLASTPRPVVAATPPYRHKLSHGTPSLSPSSRQPQLQLAR
jgi:hypothetical protein